MGVPPTRLGGYLPSPSHQFGCHAGRKVTADSPTIGNQWLGFGRPEGIEGGPWGRLPREGHEPRERARRMAWISSSGASLGGGASSAAANAARANCIVFL